MGQVGTAEHHPFDLSQTSHKPFQMQDGEDAAAKFASTMRCLVDLGAKGRCGRAEDSRTSEEEGKKGRREDNRASKQPPS